MKALPRILRLLKFDTPYCFLLKRRESKYLRLYKEVLEKRSGLYFILAFYDIKSFYRLHTIIDTFTDSFIFKVEGLPIICFEVLEHGYFLSLFLKEEEK